MNKKNNQELKMDDEKSLMSFLKDPSIMFTEFATGLLVSDKKNLTLSAGKIIQAAIKGNLITQIGIEIVKYRKEGRIKEDYFATNKSRATLYELLKFLDEEIPDEELFSALKSIFFSGISTSSTAYEESLSYEFLQTAKKLSGTEILILKANYEIFKNKNLQDKYLREDMMSSHAERSAWRKVITKQMGYGDLTSIVLKYEKNLELLGLISPRHDVDRFQSEFQTPANFRLTETGVKFCEFITMYGDKTK
ncbi:MAG: hypothetical protein V4576_02130 [Patescibacteria group bacterium]